MNIDDTKPTENNERRIAMGRTICGKRRESGSEDRCVLDRGHSGPCGWDVSGVVRSLVCQTMPTAAIASGMISPVDHSLTVANVLRDHPPAKVAEYTGSESLGIGNVVRYLVAHGLPCSDGFAKLYRDELFKKRMRDALDAEHAAKAVQS